MHNVTRGRMGGEETTEQEHTRPHLKVPLSLFDLFCPPQRIFSMLLDIDFITFSEVCSRTSVVQVKLLP